VIKLQV